jgi:hypothetical protein
LSASVVSPKIIGERLGHTTVMFTLDRYVHPDQVAHRHAADELRRLFEGIGNEMVSNLIASAENRCRDEDYRTLPCMT